MDNFCLTELVSPSDEYQMNWIEGDVTWGTVKCPDNLAYSVERTTKDDKIIERYTFTNKTNKDIFTSLYDIAIYTPFNDNYENSDVCMKKKCNTHIWCGGNISYVMALRMGGKPPHLGLILTEGSLGGYSVDRNWDKGSNDRGDFMLHPSPVSLIPNESFSIEWELFWHDGKDDFYQKLKQYPHFIDVKAENFVLFKGEQIKIYANDEIAVDETAENLGEKEYFINQDGIKTSCKILVLPKLEDLAKARCYFIAEKQQYHNEKSHLDGAYLIYDNEENRQHYDPTYDFNGGRERVGMGVLIARYLQSYPDKFLDESLRKYIKYVRRELVDEETGEVFNDYKRDSHFFRLYNYSWMSLFFTELYHLYGSVEYLKISFNVLKHFYKLGGTHFYSIAIPVTAMIENLEKENLLAEKEEIRNCFIAHGDRTIEVGTNYPPHELKYEQSIVAPAANLLSGVYKITGEQKYLDGLLEQMAVLELFNGYQPDYHMYEVSIRHWDGYWFGKRRLFGDTYPHYWSSLTGNAYLGMSEILNDKNYAKKAEYSLRASLSLFFPDGRASCAFVYPKTVTGTKAAFYDPYANDQDWGLYFMIRQKFN